MRLREWKRSFGQCLGLTTKAPPCQELHPMDGLLQTTIDEIMIPRSDIVAVSSHTPFEEVAKKFLRTGFRWLPVFRETLDTIIGMVGIHCLLSLRESGATENRWYRHLNAPTFCPSSMTILDALCCMQQDHKTSILFVVDEYGGIEGMLTRGHITKEIFHLYGGNGAEEEKMIISRDPVWVIHGRMDLETFEEEFKIYTLFDQEVENRVNTIGGWICAYLGRVPLTGEVIAHPSGFTFEIRHSTPRKIHHIAIVQTPSLVGL